MAKVSRSMLKSIVKECLVELLAEGLNSGDVEEMNESFPKIKKPSKKSLKNASVFSSSKDKIVNPRFEEKTKRIISNATNDPIMAAILEDTAQTTLQEQNNLDKPNKFTAKPTDAYSKVVSESDPMEMFEGSSNNWAALAFSDK
jgi:hypothetical protein